MALPQQVRIHHGRFVQKAAAIERKQGSGPLTAARLAEIEKRLGTVVAAVSTK